MHSSDMITGIGRHGYDHGTAYGASSFARAHSFHRKAFFCKDRPLLYRTAATSLGKGQCKKAIPRTGFLRMPNS